jgi:predicted permease
VALPILIFPSLCEFPVVHEGYIPHDRDDPDVSSQGLEQQCVAQANTMIFCYFFSWSLAFWSFGSPQLLQAAKRRSTNRPRGEKITSNQEKSHSDEEKGTDKTDTADNFSSTLDSERIPVQQEESLVLEEAADNNNESRELQQEPEIGGGDTEEVEEQQSSTLRTLCHALKQTVTSPGFIAMALGFITACIPPLQRALFEAGGPLRFLGSAVETLGSASSSISTMVVAASLVPPRPQVVENDETPVLDENPAMTDPNFGPYQRRQSRRASSLRSFREFRRSVRSGSIRLLQAVPRSTPEMIRLHLWFGLSRLIVTPAVVVGLIVAMDCGGGLLSQVPNLAKLVIIINSALPGALIVVVILKSKEEMAETAAAVAKVYLPSYLVSIVTIAAWTTVGMWITLPDKDGNTFCQRP